MSFGTTTPSDWRLDGLRREIDQGRRRIEGLEGRIQQLEDHQRTRRLRIEQAILNGLIAVTWVLAYTLIVAAVIAAAHH
jgi:hypothetical protein